MKKWPVIFIILVMAVLVFTSCRKDDPKALAKQTIELTFQLNSNAGNEKEIQAKLDAIEAKVKKMSMLNQLAYAGELIQLSAESFSEIISSPEVQESFKTMSNEFQAVSEVLNSSEYQESLKAAAEVLNSSEYQDSLKELNDALEALNALNLKF